MSLGVFGAVAGNPDVGTLTGILTEPQFRVAIQAIENRAASIFSGAECNNASADARRESAWKKLGRSSSA